MKSDSRASQSTYRWRWNSSSYRPSWSSGTSSGFWQRNRSRGCSSGYPIDLVISDELVGVAAHRTATVMDISEELGHGQP